MFSIPYIFYTVNQKNSNLHKYRLLFSIKPQIYFLRIGCFGFGALFAL